MCFNFSYGYEKHQSDKVMVGIESRYINYLFTSFHLVVKLRSCVLVLSISILDFELYLVKIANQNLNRCFKAACCVYLLTCL